ncbi:hypothetical protein M3P36_10620 [Altererythrobacter sp. KTW20L]|uniref:hypothetical protein n=1 Tax=Altererythrobacter sp. KTW20L TaxID=2942210 RepID=UPI0020C11586|nr:hypothetical protein [Altererythrobacter sp. KTW20L]MCL6251492.1 hypothetical protein [Altererythrobacter sp. KTW20L]
MIEPPAGPVDPGVLEGRTRPGFNADLPDQMRQDNPGAVRAPPPSAFPTDQIAIPDRWRLIENLGLVVENPLDPYNQNTYKGDRPICPNNAEDNERRRLLREAAAERGEEPPYGSAVCRTPAFLGLSSDKWFFIVNAISDTVIEPRTFPIPVGVQTTQDPDRLDVFGRDVSYVLSQTFIAGFALLKGSTAYAPPSVEYRLTLAYNINHVDVPERRVLFVEPSKPTHRTDHFLGVQEAFIDYHFSKYDTERYDFISIRAGIQPFQSDFRGFLFNDSQLGVRLFGNRDNNRFQFNLGAFWRLEKDTNSGLNSVVQRPRDDLVFLANLYRQDFLIPALTSQVTVVYNRNREGDNVEVDTNGFPVRPGLLGSLRGRDYDVVYLGYNADGRIGRINVTASTYAALGEDRNNFFTDRPADIRAFFAATELSYDRDWMRFRLSGAWASGDGDPFDDKVTGFDAIFENPVFAGADTSYWIRQTIPFAGGGRAISLNGRNGILNSLRSSKEQGQSNFNNPGLMLVGLGADFDISPELRLSANANHLWFENTSSLQALRVEGSIPRDIGFDLSAAAIWRPQATQNIVARLSAAALIPGAGFRDLFDNFNDHRAYVSVLANVTLTY